jgi:ferredoxin
VAVTGRLRVDRTRCAGHGICAIVAPGALDLDVWGFPEVVVAELSGDVLRRARRAAAACPRGALVIEDVVPMVQALRAPWEP